jgi:hypothetical protein
MYLVRRPATWRLLALLTLILWVLPAADATALTLHVALDHHHGEAADHHDAADALAATHGHHHHELVPDHEHSLLVPGAAATLNVLPCQVPRAALARSDTRDADSLRAPDSRAGPPELPFYSLCILRL